MIVRLNAVNVVNLEYMMMNLMHHMNLIIHPLNHHTGGMKNVVVSGMRIRRNVIVLLLSMNRARLKNLA